MKIVLSLTIRDHREDLRIRADELAWALDLKPWQLWALERGDRVLRVDQLCVMAYIFGCSLDDLVAIDT